MDLDRFAPTKYPASGQPQLVLGIGSLLPVKRWHLLIEAVNLLQGRGAAVNLRILGGGPEEGRLRQLVAELKAGDYVDLPGPRPDVAAELARASVLAHTSESEGTPNAILEAMACARPVVAFPVGDNAGIVEDGITGLLLQEQSAKAVAHALASLLSNPDLAMEMGKAGRRFVEATHSMEASARAMVQAYRLAGAEELRL
jgi:glycosyltransferase involved in cell wall biosynthesis